MEWDFQTICFAVTRAIHFFACLLILGVWIFDRLVIYVIRESAPFWPRIARRLLLISLPVALLSGIAWFGFVAIAMSGLPARDALRISVLKLVWSQTYFGTVWKWRGAIFACSVIMAFGKLPASKMRAWIATLVGIALVGSLAFSGHGQTGLWPGWHLAADVLHLLIASVWPMGLLPFALVLRQLRHLSASQGWGEVEKLTRRFSAMSLIAVMLLSLSGVVNGCCLLGSFSALVNLDYGRVLLLKIALFLGMMGFAVVNRFILMPRLNADERVESLVAGRLQINVMIELALMITVLLVTGLLGTLMPAQM